jgi:hypothetical protein
MYWHKTPAYLLFFPSTIQSKNIETSLQSKNIETSLKTLNLKTTTFKKAA